MKISYSIREYTNKFSGTKASLENALVSIIIKQINSNKYNSIDDVLKYNNNDLKTFLKNNHCDTIPLHYQSKIDDNDFELIVLNIKQMIDDKLSFNNIDFATKPYVEYEEKVFDNTETNHTIEEEMHDIQIENTDYQTLDKKENTDRIMNELFNDKKRETKFENIDDVNINLMNAEEQEIYDAALINKYINDIDKKISFKDKMLIINDDRMLDSGNNSNNFANAKVKTLGTSNHINLYDETA